MIERIAKHAAGAGLGLVVGFVAVLLLLLILIGDSGRTVSIAGYASLVLMVIGGWYGPTVIDTLKRWFAAIERRNAANDAKRRAEQSRAIAERNARPIKVFGTTINRPAFFNNLCDGGLPRQTSVFWENRADGITEGTLTFQTFRDIEHRRLLESFLESARLERAQRGYPIKDRVNNVIWPDIDDQGVVIEIADNDDGSRSAILAIGFAGSLTKQEWANANGAGFGRFYGAWEEAPYMQAAVRQKSDYNKFSMLDCLTMPLFHLRLTEVAMPAEETTYEDRESDADLPHDLPRG